MSNRIVWAFKIDSTTSFHKVWIRNRLTKPKTNMEASLAKENNYNKIEIK